MNKMQVWWIPQVPMDPFTVDIDTVEEGVKIMNVLAQYDIFQYETSIKPDYCNAGGIRVWEDNIDEDGSGDWVDWYDEETGIEDPEEYVEHIRDQK